MSENNVDTREEFNTFFQKSTAFIFNDQTFGFQNENSEQYKPQGRHSSPKEMMS